MKPGDKIMVDMSVPMHPSFPRETGMFPATLLYIADDDPTANCTHQCRIVCPGSAWDEWLVWVDPELLTHLN